jgi:hypothetical protein
VRSTWSAGERSEGEAPKAGADPFPRAARERSLPQMVSVSRLLWATRAGLLLGGCKTRPGRPRPGDTLWSLTPSIESRSRAERHA